MNRRALRSAAVLFAPIAIASGSAAAQAASGSGSSGMDAALFAPGPIADRPSLGASSRTGGLQAGGWLIYPSLTAGAVYNDNAFQSFGAKKGAWGWSLRPQFDADRDSGKNKLHTYGNLEVDSYASASRANVAAGTLGFDNNYEITRDMSWNFGGSYTRANDISSAQNTTGSAAIINYPTISDKFNVKSSVTDNFNWGFVTLGNYYNYSIYENSTNNLGAAINNTARNGGEYGITGRLGYNIGPAVAAYVEPSYNWRRFVTGTYNSDGYRVVAGLQSDRISLFKGDIFAGYQQQFYNTPGLGRPSGAVFGAKLSWFPTRQITVQVSLDEAIAESAIGSVGVPNASITKTTSSGLMVGYQVARDLTANLKGNFSDIRYVGVARHDQSWGAGANLAYIWNRNWGLTASYDHTQVLSNVAFASFSKNVYLLGATYRY